MDRRTGLKLIQSLILIRVIHVSVVTVLYRDNVEWDSEQEQAAQQKVNENSNIKVGEDQQGTELYLWFCMVAAWSVCVGGGGRGEGTTI